MTASLADDPVYRAGKWMGRNEGVTEIMDFLLNPGGGPPKERRMRSWSGGAQTLAKATPKLQIVVAETRAEEEEDD